MDRRVSKMRSSDFCLITRSIFTSLHKIARERVISTRGKHYRSKSAHRAQQRCRKGKCKQVHPMLLLAGEACSGKSALMKCQLAFKRAGLRGK